MKRGDQTLPAISSKWECHMIQYCDQLVQDGSLMQENLKNWVVLHGYLHFQLPFHCDTSDYSEKYDNPRPVISLAVWLIRLTRINVNIERMLPIICRQLCDIWWSRQPCCFYVKNNKWFCFRKGWNRGNWFNIWRFRSTYVGLISLPLLNRPLCLPFVVPFLQ